MKLIQRTKQGSKFNKFLLEFKHMKPNEQNSLIYSFTELLKRMHKIQEKQAKEQEIDSAREDIKKIQEKHVK